MDSPCPEPTTKRGASQWVTDLRELASMKREGILTEAEFTEAKEKLFLSQRQPPSNFTATADTGTGYMEPPPTNAASMMGSPVNASERSTTTANSMGGESQNWVKVSGDKIPEVGFLTREQAVARMKVIDRASWVKQTTTYGGVIYKCRMHTNCPARTKVKQATSGNWHIFRNAAPHEKDVDPKNFKKQNTRSHVYKDEDGAHAQGVQYRMCVQSGGTRGMPQWIKDQAIPLFKAGMRPKECRAYIIANNAEVTEENAPDRTTFVDLKNYHGKKDSEQLNTIQTRADLKVRTLTPTVCQGGAKICF